MTQRVPVDDSADGPPESAVRPAATVMLVRDAPAGLEVFVLRRVTQMAFAAGMTVFPGGAVDPADHDPLPWAGPDTDWWSTHLGATPGQARALVVAAVRELFEEIGVLLAGPPPGADWPLTAPGLSDADRRAILDRRTTLPAALTGADLHLRADLLRPWANWITPPGRTRRYDTFFFAAALPDGQQAQLLTTEADRGQWAAPAGLLDEWADGVTALMPPTVAMLRDLAGLASVAQVMAARRLVTPIRIRAADVAELSRPPKREPR